MNNVGLPNATRKPNPERQKLLRLTLTLVNNVGLPNPNPDPGPHAHLSPGFLMLMLICFWLQQTVVDGMDTDALTKDNVTITSFEDTSDRRTSALKVRVRGGLRGVSGVRVSRGLLGCCSDGWVLRCSSVKVLGG